MGSTEAALWSGLFRIAPESGRTLQSQIRQAVVSAVLSERVAPERPLPSCRALARQLGVARGTVVLAYQQLVDQGFLVSRERHGHFVNPDALPREPEGADARRTNGGGAGTAANSGEGALVDWSARIQHPLADLRVPTKPADWLSHPYPFVYGQFDPALFPVNEWRECSRMALGVREIREWAADMADRDDPMLIEQLRTRLLPRRGIFARSDEILITLGAQNALYMLAELLAGPDTVVGVENPGYPDARHAFALRARAVAPVTVDALGLDPDAIPAEARVVVCTPSHQCPTNASMPIDRREALLEWAERADGIVVEDDYDSQLLDAMGGDNRPLPALKSLDRTGRVAHVGSLSKTLAPGLRLGYVVADAKLIGALRRLRRLVLRHAPANNQRALAIFVSLGHHDTLLRRLSVSIRGKREALRTALDLHLPGFQAAAPGGGTSVWLRCPPGVHAAALAARAAAHGVIVEPGEVFHMRAAGNPPADTLRMGVTAIDARRIDPGVRKLAEATREIAA